MKRHRTPEIGQHCFEVYTLGLEFSVERLAGAPHLPCNEVYAGVPGVQNRHQQIICRRLRGVLLLPEHARIIALASSVPQAIGEIGFGGWMLIKGIRPSTGTTSDPAPPPQLSPAR